MRILAIAVLNVFMAVMGLRIMMVIELLRVVLILGSNLEMVSSRPIRTAPAPHRRGPGQPLRAPVGGGIEMSSPSHPCPLLYAITSAAPVPVAGGHEAPANIAKWSSAGQVSISDDGGQVHGTPVGDAPVGAPVPQVGSPFHCVPVWGTFVHAHGVIVQGVSVLVQRVPVVAAPMHGIVVTAALLEEIHRIALTHGVSVQPVVASAGMIAALQRLDAIPGNGPAAHSIWSSPALTPDTLGGATTCAMQADSSDGSMLRTAYVKW